MQLKELEKQYSQGKFIQVNVDKQCHNDNNFQKNRLQNLK